MLEILAQEHRMSKSLKSKLAVPYLTQGRSGFDLLAQFQDKTWALRGKATQGRFSSILAKGDNICDFLFAFLTLSPFRKKSKNKEQMPYS